MDDRKRGRAGTYETVGVIRTDAIERLPVRHAVPELLSALDGRGTAVLSAPPGTGKTTLVPLALAGLTGTGPRRRVLVAEPRRMAVRAAARRMAWLLGQEVGEAVGFSVRGERRTGPGTVVEVVTTGVLLQRLQRDPELAGVDVVLLDECHERHLDADTAIAFLVDVRAALRPELQLIAASATSDAEAWSQLLTVADGTGPAPVVRSTGQGHGAAVHYAPPPAGIRPAHGTWVDQQLLRHVAATVRLALEAHEGDLLCFLPGTGEIARTAGMLDGVDAEVLQLHGRAPAAVQDAVLRGGEGRRRVVLATSVAESSLTVPGVRIVVDSGLAREPRVDHARGSARWRPWRCRTPGRPSGWAARAGRRSARCTGAGRRPTTRGARASPPRNQDRGSGLLRLAGGVLGRSDRTGTGTARRPARRGHGGGPLRPDRDRRGGRGRPGHRAGREDGPARGAPPAGQGAPGRRGRGGRAPGGRGGGAAERGAAKGVRG